MSDHESDAEDLFASPTAKHASREKPARPKTPSNPPNNRYDDPEESREANLRRELEGVRNINELIEGVVGTLERAKGNMHVWLYLLTPYLSSSLYASNMTPVATSLATSYLPSSPHDATKLTQPSTP